MKLNCYLLLYVLFSVSLICPEKGSANVSSWLLRQVKSLNDTVVELRQHLDRFPSKLQSLFLQAKVCIAT